MQDKKPQYPQTYEGEALKRFDFTKMEAMEAPVESIEFVDSTTWIVEHWSGRMSLTFSPPRFRKAPWTAWVEYDGPGSVVVAAEALPIGTTAPAFRDAARIITLAYIEVDAEQARAHTRDERDAAIGDLLAFIHVTGDRTPSEEFAAAMAEGRVAFTNEVDGDGRVVTGIEITAKGYHLMDGGAGKFPRTTTTAEEAQRSNRDWRGSSIEGLLAFMHRSGEWVPSEQFKAAIAEGRVAVAYTLDGNGNVVVGIKLALEGAALEFCSRGLDD